MTRVDVLFNGAKFTYMFDIPLEDFKKKWNNSIPVVGYVSAFDVADKLIIINPSNCGAIEIYEEE